MTDPDQSTALQLTLTTVARNSQLIVVATVE